jgi:KTSC domain
MPISNVQSLITKNAVAVESSALTQVAYDGEHKLLTIAFCDGSAYQYSAVSVQIYEDLLRADSKGAYFNRKIRAHFPMRVVEMFTQMA